MRGTEGERLRGGVLGLGLLMGGAVFSFGHSVGCTKAEILAIKDDGESSCPSQYKHPFEPASVLQRMSL